MNRIPLSPCLSVLVLLTGQLTAQESIKWQSDVGVARKASQQWGAPVLIHFYGDNCLPCKTLEQRVFMRPEVISTVNTYFIPVRINASADRQTAAEFQVHSWPTDVFVSPDGKTLSQGISQQDPNAYLQNLQNIAIMNRDRRIMLAAERSGSSQAKSNYAPALADQRNPQGQLPAAQSSQPPVGNLAANPSNVFSIGGPQTGPLQNTSALPPIGQANSSSNLANPVANAQSATRVNTAQASNVQRGPVDIKTQPSPIHGAVAGSSQSHTAPNLPAPAQVPNSQYASATKAPGSGVNWQPQTSAAQTTNLTGANGMPNMLAVQIQNTSPGQTRLAVGNQSRSLLVSNPHYPATTAQTPNPVLTSEPQPSLVASEPTSGSIKSEPPALAAGSAVGQNRASIPMIAQNTASIPEASAYGSRQTSLSVDQPARGSTPTSLVLGGSPSPAATSTNPPAVETKPESVVPALTTPPATSPSAAPAFHPVAAKVENASTKDVSTQSLADTAATPIAFEGYCPVALLMSKLWVAGQENFAVMHRGRTYHMSSKLALDAFLASPDNYTPVLSGYDPMVFLEQGKLVLGSFEFGSIDLQTHAIYLFSSQADKSKFETNFEANSKALNILISKSRPSGAQAN